MINKMANKMKKVANLPVESTKSRVVNSPKPPAKNNLEFSTNSAFGIRNSAKVMDNHAVDRMMVAVVLSSGRGVLLKVILIPKRKNKKGSVMEKMPNIYSVSHTERYAPNFPHQFSTISSPPLFTNSRSPAHVK